MKEYFESIEKEVGRAYHNANLARARGYDPEEFVEIPIAKDMVERSVSLILTVAPTLKKEEMISRIRELEGQYGMQDWRVAMAVSLETAQGKFGDCGSELKNIETGLRLGMAYLTNGVVASPLEGFTELKFRKRRDGKEYFNIVFSGPIRSAGTTAVCIWLALVDYVRKQFGYAEYDITEQEIKRTITELNDFHERITNLQYLPSEEELAFMLQHLPMQIDGTPSEEMEVSNHRDLDRIDTNLLRNGVCLVLGECLTQKASKFWNKFSKWYKDFDMGNWIFLEEFVKVQQKIRAKDKEGKHEKIKPDFGFIKDVVAGRPVFTYPMGHGGFRLRYGRCRNTGLSSQAVHPATMAVL
ncbi:DNA polymerase II large subunit, partial [Candidatus Woesearchaeota archaeon]|nr:DNA polymerase II large subunit [Candidatus Woesearchaeota archaeon]